MSSYIIFKKYDGNNIFSGYEYYMLFIKLENEKYLNKNLKITYPQSTSCGSYYKHLVYFVQVFLLSIYKTFIFFWYDIIL